MKEQLLHRILVSSARISGLLAFILIVLPISFAAMLWLYSLTLRVDVDRRLPPPGRMIDIGSHSMHLDCRGPVAAPTILLEAGSGGWSTSWAPLRTAVEKPLRICAYDRSGMGWSERGPHPRDNHAVVRELEALVRASGERAPFILIGFSGGGPLAWLYASRNRESVAGVVMVDSVTAHYRRSAEDSASRVRLFVRDNLRPLLILQETAGLVLSPPDTASTRFRSYSEFEKSVVEDVGFRSRMIYPSSAEEAGHSNLAYMDDLGALPLVVIEAGRTGWPVIEGPWREGQQTLLRRSRRSAHIVADNVGHNIPALAPEQIVKAIEWLIDQLGEPANGN